MTPSGHRILRLPAAETLGSRAERRENAFDLLRLVAAAMVLVSHSFPLVGSREPTLGEQSLGSLGVLVFFTISGFLITKSWLLQPRLVPFAAKRALRLLPALAVTVALTALVIGPLVTTLPLGTYLTSPGPYLYVFNNVRLATDFDLPGVFANVPFAHAVNGSLWTLPIEVKAYALIALLGLVRVLRRALLPVVALGLVLTLAWPDMRGWTGFAHHVPGGLGRLGLDQDALRLITVFCVSALLYVVRERVPLHGGLLALAVALWVASIGTPLETVAVVLALPYAVLYLGFRRLGPLAALTRPGDVSYGLYLWAFPVQQCVVSAVGATLSPWGMIALALPITYGLALASWRLVEAPALRLKRRVAVPLRTPDAHAHFEPGDVTASIAAGQRDGSAVAPGRPRPERA
jgi:peptidoglycan/LPS O-acetylase OafA/YrhL